MYLRNRPWQLPVLAALTLALVLLLQPTHAQAQQVQQSPMMVYPGTITVAGTGRVAVEPEIARVSIGVDVVDDNIRDALTAHEEQMEAVLDALEEQGIAERDIQTSGFSIFPETFGPEGPLPPDQIRYRVVNTVQVVVRDIDAIGEVLDAAIDAGANQIYGINFDVDDTNGWQSEARSLAIDDARNRAQELAGLVEVELGNVIAVSEIVGFAIPFDGRGGMGVFQDAAVPIQPGQLQFSMQVQVVYAIANGTGTGTGGQ
jgi:uncharacterized protein